MPPLRHKVGDEFDIMRSEVAAWLCEQPSIRQYAFDIAHAAGVIVYDAGTGEWRGVGTETAE